MALLELWMRDPFHSTSPINCHLHHALCFAVAFGRNYGRAVRSLGGDRRRIEGVRELPPPGASRIAARAVYAAF
jgi:hypothetical protein